MMLIFVGWLNSLPLNLIIGLLIATKHHSPLNPQRSLRLLKHRPAASRHLPGSTRKPVGRDPRGKALAAGGVSRRIFDLLRNRWASRGNGRFSSGPGPPPVAAR